MNIQDPNSLWEAGLRDELTAAQKTRLEETWRDASDAAWEEDLCLNALLRRLPDQPVPTNFTRLVLDQVARPKAGRSAVRPSWRRGLLAWLPKPALASVLLGVGLLGYFQYQSHARMELARSVARISEATSWVGLETLLDFEAIDRLGRQEVPVDEQLLAALQ